MGIGTEIAVGLAETAVNMASGVLTKLFPDMPADQVQSFKEGLASNPTVKQSLIPGASIVLVIMAISSILDHLLPNKSAEDRYNFILALQQEFDRTQLLNAQSTVNIAETEIARASSNIWMQVFWAGFRPFTAWICALAFALSLIEHVGVAILGLIGMHISIDPINSTLMYQMLMGLLGLGTMRSFDKLKGTNKDQ